MRFRTKATGSKTINLAGGKAYQPGNEWALVSLVLTSFLKDKFYETSEDQLRRLNDLISKNDPKFVAQLGIYARNVFGMRSVTHVIAASLPYIANGQPWVKEAIHDIVRRPDDMLEILAVSMGGEKKTRPVPNALKKGLALALQKFGAYQLGKYKGEGSSVKMVDLFNIVHPRPVNRKQEELWKDLMSGTLKAEGTWEMMLTQAGQKVQDIKDPEKREKALAREKKAAWRDLLSEGKIGYFALLRNLRNIAEQAPEYIDVALDMLTNEAMIKKSLVMPFRFTTAYDIIEGNDDGMSRRRGEPKAEIDSSLARKILSALDEAVEISCSNVPVLKNTCILMDISGSMSGKPSQIASLFSALLCKTNNCDVIKYDTNAEYVNYNNRDSVMTMARHFKFDGGGTDVSCAVRRMRKAYDRVIILSDEQSWVDRNRTLIKDWNNYCQKFNTKPYLYSWDLQGYGSLQFPKNMVYTIAGWSDKAFDLMAILEQDKDAVVNTIKEYEIETRNQEE